MQVTIRIADDVGLFLAAGAVGGAAIIIVILVLSFVITDRVNRR